MATTSKKTAEAGQTTRGQHEDISRVDRGIVTDVSQSEDAKRADGTDASSGAGEHDSSAAAIAGQDPGGTVLDAYATNREVATHDNMAAPIKPLVVGEAPHGRNRPEQGSVNHGHAFHPSVPNPTMQSPIVRGTDGDPNVKNYAGLRREAIEAEGRAAEVEPAEVQPVE